MPTHFAEGESIKGPYHPTSEVLTIAFWANWESGPGPLVKTGDGAWAFPYEEDGRCAYRLGDEPRVLSLAVSELRGRWALFALAVSGSEATLWIDEGAVDVWPDPVSRPQSADLVLMEDAVGSAAHFAVFEDAVPQEKLRQLWLVGTNDPELLAE